MENYTKNYTTKDTDIIKAQIDSITCGATVVAMVADYLLRENSDNNEKSLKLPIEQISDLMGVDSKTGTTHQRMMAGLKAFGIEYERFTGDTNSVDHIVEGLKTKDFLVPLRCSMDGKGNYLHWLLATEYKDGKIKILDPGSGRIYWQPTSFVEKIIAPRDWEHYFIPKKQLINDIKLENFALSYKDKNIDKSMDMLKLMGRGIGDIVNLTEPVVIGIINSKINKNITKILTLNNKVIGGYVLSEADVLNVGLGVEIKELEHKKGVEGVALYVDDEYRDFGFGKMLRNLPRRLGYDYVFGSQLKTLNNIDDWLKHRVMVAENKSGYLTLQYYAGNEKLEIVKKDYNKIKPHEKIMEEITNGDEKIIKYKDGSIEYQKNEKLHRVDGPAVIDDNLIMYYIEGIKHRDDGPAVTYKYKNEKIEEYYKDGLLHREDGPAIDSESVKEYYLYGVRHRDNGPAVIEKGVEMYYKNGIIHNDQGPAIIYTMRNGKKEEYYYLHGSKVSQSNFEKFKNNNHTTKNVKTSNHYFDTNSENYTTTIVGNEEKRTYSNGKIEYLLDGLRHRDNGPAYIADDVEKYYYNGKLHRIDGPAIVYKDNNASNLHEFYYLNGDRLTKEEFDLSNNKIDFMI
jgi:hypothetical protein